MILDGLDDPVTGAAVASVERVHPPSIAAAAATVRSRYTGLIQFIARVVQVGFPVGVRLNDCGELAPDFQVGLWARPAPRFRWRRGGVYL